MTKHEAWLVCIGWLFVVCGLLLFVASGLEANGTMMAGLALLGSGLTGVGIADSVDWD